MKIKIMKGKMRKKVLVIGVTIGIILIATGWIWYRWPYFQEYKEIKMRPTWDISENIRSAPTHRTFAYQLYQAGYNNFLHEKGPYTLFAPTDQAYANLPSETRDFFTRPENYRYLKQDLLYHIVEGLYPLSQLRDGMTLKTVQGEELKFTRKDGFWVINGYSYIATPDVVSKNGVIHRVTNYLIPGSMLIQK